MSFQHVNTHSSSTRETRLVSDNMAKDEPTRNRAKKLQAKSHDITPEKDSSSLHTKVLVIALSVSALIVGVYIQLAKNLSESLAKSSEAQIDHDSVLVVAENMDAGYLDHVVAALLNYGHKLSFRDSLTPLRVQDLDQYDLVWTHDYPFQSIKKLHPRQRINHFPGTGFITNKMTLSTTPGVPNALKAYQLPAERDKFKAFSKQEQDKLWIQKSSSHRGISIETTGSVDLDRKDTLVQEYMSNPLLIDGKKFDIGIYATLTSVEPLRVYIYEAESLLRFCSDPYLDKQTGQFNSSNIDSYVVGDDYTPIWLMPSLLRYYIGTNLSMKETLNSYLRRLGQDGAKIWKNIEETIKKVYKLKEHHIGRMSRMYQEANNYNDTSIPGSLNQFFEMVRFDFIVNEKLEVFLMEANMSPNLSSRHFPPNRLIYEHVLNSYFSLAGLTHFARQQLSDLPIHHLDGKITPSSNKVKLEKERYGLNEVISEKELSVYEDLCVSDECHMNCHKIDCKVCYFCLSEPDKLHLRRAIFEQYSRWNFKRLLPSTDDEDLELQLVHPETNMKLIDSNYIHVQWFRGKCYTDKRFCSY